MVTASLWPATLGYHPNFGRMPSARIRWITVLFTAAVLFAVPEPVRAQNTVSLDPVVGGSSGAQKPEVIAIRLLDWRSGENQENIVHGINEAFHRDWDCPQMGTKLASVDAVSFVPRSLKCSGVKVDKDGVNLTVKVGGSGKVTVGRPKFNILRNELIKVVTSMPAAPEPYKTCVRYTLSGTSSWTAGNPRYDNATLFVVLKAPKSHYFPVPLQIIILAILLVLSGLFSGLNLGLMTLDPTELQLIIKSGTKQERRYAETIMPVRRTGNYLLCSLLLGNVIVNAAISILFDDLTSGLVALAVSSLGIVIFGEIVPQSICNRQGLAVGARTIYITKFFMYVTAPLAFPISKILDFVLGEEAGTVYSKERIVELIRMTITQESALGMSDELGPVIGALTYMSKTVKDVMTPVTNVFMLSCDTILNVKNIASIVSSGYTRIPVFESDDRNHIVAILNVKDLALLDPDDNLSVKTVCSYYEHAVFFVLEEASLKYMLEEFRQGLYHLAVVQKVVEPEDGGDPYFLVTGIVTLEDIIEEIIQAEINDETDMVTDNVHRKRRPNALAVCLID